MPVGAIVGDDDSTDTAGETEQDAPADLAEGSEGGEPVGAGEVDGGAAPGGDGDGAPDIREEEGAQAEAESQGLTLKDIVGRAPYELRRRLPDGD